MVRDRIQELQANRRNGSNFAGGLFQDVHTIISSSKKVNGLLDKATGIRESIKLIAQNVEKIKELHNNVLSHTNPDIKREVESRTMIIDLTASRIHVQLKELIGDNSNTDDFVSAGDGSTYTRMKVLQYTTMRQLFSQIMLEYNESLLRYHEKCSSLLHQQRVLIRKPSVNGECFDEDVDEEKKSLFVDNILEDSHVAKQQLSDIRSRHEEVLKLEKSIIEIRDIFLEMAYAVEQQGDRLNCVEYFASQATSNVDGGRNDLSRAKKKSQRYRKVWKKRKWKIIIVITLIVVILLIIAVYL